MPYAELQNEKSGAYFLVSTTADEDAEEFVVSKSVTSSQDSYALEEPASMMRCERRADGCWLNLHKRDYYAVAMPISLYSRNAPFSEEHWLLIGAVNSQTLFSFAQNVRHVLTAVVVGTLVLGILSSLLIAHKLATRWSCCITRWWTGRRKRSSRSCPIQRSGSWIVWPMH